jgi:hypothetical protein
MFPHSPNGGSSLEPLMVYSIILKIYPKARIIGIIIILPKKRRSNPKALPTLEKGNFNESKTIS